MKSPYGVGMLATILTLGALPASAQGETAGIHQDLQALVRVTTRLVESLERQESTGLADRDLQRIQVAVQLLDIRVRQLDSLQEGLEDIDSREQRLHGYVAANEVKVENLEKQLAEAVDESKRTMLEAGLAELLVYGGNQKNELEYLAQRRGTLQARLVGGERSVLEIEDLIQDWVAEAQHPAREAPR